VGLLGGYIVYKVGKNRGEKKEARRSAKADSANNCIICESRRADCGEHGEVVFCSVCCGCN
jgi:hypothetical protein